MSETILPDNAVVYVRHAYRGQPIELCMGPGDHSVIVKRITPCHALDIAQMLVQYAQTELCHPRKADD